MFDRSVISLLVILALPFLACLLILFAVPGIERALLLDGLKVGALLIAAGVALSFGASALAARSEERSGKAQPGGTVRNDHPT
jgi:hypothetical protein